MCVVSASNFANANNNGNANNNSASNSNNIRPDSLLFANQRRRRYPFPTGINDKAGRNLLRQVLLQR